MPISRIAITTGEPAGIGPDITLAAALRSWPAELVAVADPEMLAARAEQLELDIQLVTYDGASAPSAHRPGRLQVQPIPLTTTAVPGTLDVRNAGYVLQTLTTALEGCLEGVFQAMVTAPVQKSVIGDAGYSFTGHTEFLAERSGSHRVVMLLTTGQMRVALATTHLPLAAVPGAITAASLTETLQIVHRELRDRFAIDRPRIAVLGLNPHAGEGGHLGREEIDVIVPVLEQLRGEGMQLAGPLPADTAFNPASLAQCDAVLAMYHDQGLPVLKHAGFGDAVNVTLGLPILRTSVDHGTALDLAATGKASSSSLEAALGMAIELSDCGRDNIP